MLDVAHWGAGSGQMTGTECCLNKTCSWSGPSQLFPLDHISSRPFCKAAVVSPLGLTGSSPQIYQRHVCIFFLYIVAGRYVKTCQRTTSPRSQLKTPSAAVIHLLNFIMHFDTRIIKNNLEAKPFQYILITEVKKEACFYLLESQIVLYIILYVP